MEIAKETPDKKKKYQN